MIHPESIAVAHEITIREALARLDESGCGLLLVVDSNRRLTLTVTDGDLRRLLLGGATLETQLTALPPSKPVTIRIPYTLRECLECMKAHSIKHLPAIDENGQVQEILEWKDIQPPILLSPPHIGNTERDFVAEAFESNWIAPLGPNVDAFEQELAGMVGVEHAAAVSSGTAALHLALRVLGVECGDKVLCSSFTFIASVNPILYQGAIPVLIDSEPESWNMSPAALARALQDAEQNGQLPKAAIIVNLYGQSADMDALEAVLAPYNIPIIEDAAESLGARYKNRSSGTIGKLGIYSFNGNKIITTSGGGMLVSNDGELIDKARFLATQAKDNAPWYEHTKIGYNYRMSNILAGVGRGQLRVLQDRVETRRGIFQRYQQMLKGINGLEWMPEPDWSYSNRWLSTLTLDPALTHHNASSLIPLLSEDLIEVRHLWKPMHAQPLFKDVDFFAHDPETNSGICDQLFEHGLCLPSGSAMTNEEVDRVADRLHSALNSG